MRGSAFLLGVLLLAMASSNLGQEDVCHCGDGQSGFTVFDSDCLDDILCRQCQPCSIRCCTGTTMWAPFTAAVPWSLRSDYAVVSTRWPWGGASVFVMGGRTVPRENQTAVLLNDVWESADGRMWANRSLAGWSPRALMGAAAFNDSIWVMGGEGEADAYLSDVWRYRGVRGGGGGSWSLVTLSAAWGRRRGMSVVFLPSFTPTSQNASEQAAVKHMELEQPTLFLIGGVGPAVAMPSPTTGPQPSTTPVPGAAMANASQSAGADGTNGTVSPRPASNKTNGTSSDGAAAKGEELYTDVWAAVNASTWTMVTSSTGGKARTAFAVVSHFPPGRVPKILIIGGLDANGVAVDQVLVSRDGQTWLSEEHREHQQGSWSARGAIATASDGHQVIIAGGVTPWQNGEHTLYNDVYISFAHCHDSGCASAGVEWTYGIMAARFSRRAGAHLVALEDTIVLIGGWSLDQNQNKTHLLDVWVTQARCRPGQVGPACHACEPGTYSGYEGILTEAECVKCPKGKAAPDPGMGACTACSPGTYGSEEGMNKCDLCPAGTIQVAEGSVACEECGAGSFQRMQGQTECTQCPERYYCPQGTVEPKGCPLGSSTEFGEGISLESCTCVRGFFSVTAKAPCTACPMGTYQAGSGASHCLSCPEGKTTASDASILDTECEAVEPAAPPPDIATPSPVPVGRYSISVGIVTSAAALNASGGTLLQAVANTALVSVSAVSFVSVKEYPATTGVYTVATIAVTASLPDLQDVTAQLVLGDLNDEMDALGLPRAYSLVSADMAASIQPPVIPTPTPATPPPSPVAPAPTPSPDIVSGKGSVDDGLANDMEVAGAAAAVVLFVSIICGCCVWRFFRYIRGGGASQGGLAEEESERSTLRGIRMKQLPLAFKSARNSAQGYERASLVAGAQDQDED